MGKKEITEDMNRLSGRQTEPAGQAEPADRISQAGTAEQGEGADGMDDDLRKAKLLGEEIGFAGYSGIEVLEVSEGVCRGRIAVHEHHMNPLHTVHGGVFFTLADTICGIAAASTGHGGPTVQGDMDYLRAVRGKEIVCAARVTKTGKTLTWVDGVITDDTGREVAHTKFIYYRLKEARHFGFESRD